MSELPPRFEHQEYMITQRCRMPGDGLWHEMGTGKSRIIVEQGRALFETQEIDGIIVLAAANVYLNWYREFGKYWPEVKPFHWSAANPWKAQKALDASLASKECRVFLMNVETLSDKKGVGTYALSKYIKAHAGRLLMVIDESNVIGNPDAGRTKVIMALAKSCKFRRALSGTPGIETPMKLWSQLEFLKPSITGRTFFQYKNFVGIWTQVRAKDRFFPKLTGYRNIDWVRQMMNEVGTFKSKAECHDLPPKLYKTYEVEMDPEQARLYRELIKKGMIEINGQELVIPENAMDKMYKLHNLASGFVKTDEGVTWVSQRRVKSLLELIDEIPPDKKMIIFSPSRVELALLDDALSAHLGTQAITRFWGGIDIEVRNRAVDEFQNNAAARVFLANQQAAGRSLTLTAATYVIYFRNDYSLDVRVQSEDRAHRVGQTESVTIIDLCTRGTVDEGVINALHNKYDVASNIIPFLKETLSTAG